MIFVVHTQTMVPVHVHPGIHGTLEPGPACCSNLQLEVLQVEHLPVNRFNHPVMNELTRIAPKLGALAWHWQNFTLSK